MANLLLTPDIWTYICGYLSNRNKCRFLICNKILYRECQPLFTEKVKIHKIFNNKFYDRFTSIDASDREIPNGFDFPFNMNRLEIRTKDLKFRVSDKVTQLVLHEDSELPIAMFPPNLKKTLFILWI